MYAQNFENCEKMAGEFAPMMLKTLFVWTSALDSPGYSNYFDFMYICFPLLLSWVLSLVYSQCTLVVMLYVFQYDCLIKRKDM